MKDLKHAATFVAMKTASVGAAVVIVGVHYVLGGK